MPIVGDTITVGTRLYRFEGTPNAYRPWNPWSGNVYTGATLAAAKATVPIDDSVDERVVELQDTGANVSYIYIQKAAGYGATFDLSFDLLMSSDLGFDIQSKTKAQTAAGTFTTGEMIFISDIDTSQGYLMTYDGTDAISGKYWMQLGSSTIQSSPSLNEIYIYANQFWECIDATGSAEVFKVTTQLDITDHVGSATLTAAQCKGAVHTNKGAGVAVTLTLPSASAGLSLFVQKGAASKDLTIAAGGGDDIDGKASLVHDYDGPQDESIHLIAVDDTTWAVVGASGFWLRLNEGNKESNYLIDHGISATLETNQVRGQVHTNSGASGTLTLTLPVAAIGYTATFIKRVDKQFIIEGNGSETIDGQLNLINEENGELNTSVTLYCSSSTRWHTIGASGAWARQVGKFQAIAHTASDTLLRNDCFGFTHTHVGASGDIVLTLPSAEEGMEITVVKTQGANRAITITAGGGDNIMGQSSIKNDSNQTNEAITLKCIDTTVWEIVSAYGQWKNSNSPQITYDFTGDSSLEREMMFNGTFITNDGAAGAVNITSATEAEGMWIKLFKIDNQNLVFKNSGGSTIISNTASESGKYIDLYYVDGSWRTGASTGTWA